MKRREKILPWVKDWTSPQNNIRLERDVSKLDFTEWFFLHPTAFLLIHYGSDMLSMLIFAVITAFFSLSWIGFLSMLMFIFIGYNFFKKVRMWNPRSKATFYDLWMRDDVFIPVQEVVGRNEVGK